MAVTVTPAALPAPKKNGHYQVVLQAAGGTGPYAWSVSSGALPAGFTVIRIDDSRAIVSGRGPSTLVAGTFTATITATDSLSATGTCISTAVNNSQDGPDLQGYHGTEANRTTVTLLDAVDHGPGLPVADYILRMWPLTGPSQNS
jgi:large repetitive protein